ncbi:hypothetical protein RUM44_009192 [Polyplax serrata]|uniref:Receptor-binding cancer antigen expressed on SiSo cells n=1 Tax=Polyplax serrata TaxID=468196 RepID=A0ABR1ARZ6_POLSC
MVNFVGNAFLTIFQFLLRVFNKALCCFRRRRRLSCDPVPLTNIGVVPNVDNDSDVQMWNSWGDTDGKGPTMITTGKPIDPVQQQIEMYRQQRMALSQSEKEEELKIDYFQDMAPKIIKQTKMFLQPKENEDYINSKHYSLAPDPVFNSSELGVWEDTQTWEDETEQAWDMLREKKKIEREERLAKQQKKLEKARSLQGGPGQMRNNFCSFPERVVSYTPG